MIISLYVRFIDALYRSCGVFFAAVIRLSSLFVKVRQSLRRVGHKMVLCMVCLAYFATVCLS